MNFKKIYFNLFHTDLYFYKNIREKNINININEEDYFNIYNYKNINRREIEEPLFKEDNEKYYYNYLKIFFLKENFYDTFIDDNYIKVVNYNNFIYFLKNKVFFKKYNKKYNNIFFKEILPYLDPNNNILQIKDEIINNSFLKK
jgi:hypothetical protein